MLHPLRILLSRKDEEQTLVHSYELRPINLFNLREGQATAVLDHFIQFLKHGNGLCVLIPCAEDSYSPF